MRSDDRQFGAAACGSVSDALPPDGQAKVDSYAIFNLGLGYRLKDIGFGKNLTIQANVTNLGDESYISTMGSNGFGNNGDRATFLAGAPQQWFISLNGQF